MSTLVLKIGYTDERTKVKALKEVARFRGISSIALDEEEKEVTITGVVNPIALTGSVKEICDAHIIRFGPKQQEKKKKKKNGKEKKIKQVQWGYPLSSPSYISYTPRLPPSPPLPYDYTVTALPPPLPYDYTVTALPPPLPYDYKVVDDEHSNDGCVII